MLTQGHQHSVETYHIQLSFRSRWNSYPRMRKTCGSCLRPSSMHTRRSLWEWQCHSEIRYIPTVISRTFTLTKVMRKVAEAASIQSLPKYPARHYSSQTGCMRSSLYEARPKPRRVWVSRGRCLTRSPWQPHSIPVSPPCRTGNSPEKKTLRHNELKEKGRYANFRLRAIPTGN